MTSLLFNGSSSSYLSIPNNNQFNFGTGDFTIEWYQYQTDNNSYPRIFQVGTHSVVGSGATIGVSIESGTIYYWSNGVLMNIRTLSASDYKNKWVHFAITRSSGTRQIFMNGVSISSLSDATNYNDTTNTLIIGNQSSPDSSTAFGGYITYFSWVKGVARYTSNFTVSNAYPPLTNNTVLLLTALSFDGTLGSTVVNNGVGTIANVPPNFLLNKVVRPTRSLFSDNSMVFYKRGSLASCGVGTVRNSSAKKRKI